MALECNVRMGPRYYVSHFWSMRSNLPWARRRPAGIGTSPPTGRRDAGVPREGYRHERFLRTLTMGLDGLR